MCGIFAFFNQEDEFSPELLKKLHLNAEKIKHRGPDNTTSTIVNKNLYLVFHRLSINDLSDRGNQPLYYNKDANILLICNGEIFNYNDLLMNFKFSVSSSSDCEIILHLYVKYGIKKTLELLDGDFAFVLVDKRINKIFAARDPLGVRSMYIGYTSDKSTVIASEMKSLNDICENVQQFKPGFFYELNSLKYEQYYFYSYPIIHSNPINENDDILDITLSIKKYLNNSVKKRLLSDRPIGCLLSGGLDSSLVTALVVKNLPNIKVKTFSIGFENSVDIVSARKVAEFLGTEHHEVIVSEEDMLNALDDVIKLTETYDTTTIRASTPMYLLSKYIKNNTDVTVIFSGEGSDEASGSYMYFHNAPSMNDFYMETVRLLEDLCFFDVLRGDKSTSSCGLEIRVPFLDKEFLDFYMKIDPELKMPNKFGIEKYLLRKAWENDNLLPKEILWRKKEAMSDGVSTQTRGWFEIIQEFVDKKISDDEFLANQHKYKFNTPLTKESMYFRNIFEKYYPNLSNTIPYYWLPKWCGDIKDPSARILNCYNNENKLSA